MAKNITLMGADYPDVPAVKLPQTGGGTATFYDLGPESVIFFGTFPNGKDAWTSMAKFSVPFINPEKKTPTIDGVYIYASDGTYVNETAGSTVANIYQSHTNINVPFSSAHAGKMIRIDLH